MKTFHKILCSLCIIILNLFYFNLYLFADYLVVEENERVNTIFSDSEVNMGKRDSSSTKPLYEDEILKSELPMGYVPTQLQDSIYHQAKRLKIPVSVRLQNDLKRFSESYNPLMSDGRRSNWQIVLDNLAIRADILAPSPVEVVNRQIMIDNAFYVPYLPNRINSGFSISPQQIGIFLGLLEDVSPEIKFELEYTEEIEIVIYSLQATVVANVFKGIRNPGTHKFVWNLRDDRGRPMPKGDYVAEVRIGTSKYYRKRIHIP